MTTPATVEEFRERLAELSDSLPKRLRQCADYIAANTDRIAVSTVAELAAGADVPPSALMRFCQMMGFSGFSEMQKLFREAYSPGWPDYSTRLKNLKETGAGSPRRCWRNLSRPGGSVSRRWRKPPMKGHWRRRLRCWPQPRRCMWWAFAAPIRSRAI
ncbi:MurR/RpiR family transcriptional regulator [Gemmobacter lanyuensis]